MPGRSSSRVAEPIAQTPRFVPGIDEHHLTCLPNQQVHNRLGRRIASGLISWLNCRDDTEAHHNHTPSQLSLTSLALVSTAPLLISLQICKSQEIVWFVFRACASSAPLTAKCVSARCPVSASHATRHWLSGSNALRNLKSGSGAVQPSLWNN